MGFRTVDDVLDNAPEDLTSAERLVLVVLAGYADDDNRECWPGREHLIRRTGLKEDSLRKVFQRLAKRGLDPRVPIGTDKSGRLVFAYEGAKTKYRVPKFPTQWRDVSPPTDPETGPPSRLSTPSGGTTVPQWGDHSPLEAGPQSPPNHQEPSRTSLSIPTSTPDRATPPGPPEERETPATPNNNQTTAAQRAIRTTDAVPVDQEQAFITWVTARHNPRGPGWWRTATNDLPELAQAWLAEQATTSLRPAGPALPPVCARCEADHPAARFNASLRFHDNKPCTACHPDGMPAAA